jgi:hypothetical protein
MVTSTESVEPSSGDDVASTVNIGEQGEIIRLL